MVFQGSGSFCYSKFACFYIKLLLFIPGFTLVIARRNSQNDFDHLEFVDLFYGYLNHN